mmetsp:Transcript_109649/g.353990  ORF Transcript_109649/g.353990 Transcript_109649/m.353990 type:complete len:306 (+) Transcript_109649:1666-2583(+)
MDHAADGRVAVAHTTQQPGEGGDKVLARQGPERQAVRAARGVAAEAPALQRLLHLRRVLRLQPPGALEVRAEPGEVRLGHALAAAGELAEELRAQRVRQVLGVQGGRRILHDLLLLSQRHLWWRRRRRRDSCLAPVEARRHPARGGAEAGDHGLYVVQEEVKGVGWQVARHGHHDVRDEDLQPVPLEVLRNFFAAGLPASAQEDALLGIQGRVCLADAQRGGAGDALGGDSGDAAVPRTGHSAAVLDVEGLAIVDARRGDAKPDADAARRGLCPSCSSGGHRAAGARHGNPGLLHPRGQRSMRGS